MAFVFPGLLVLRGGATAERGHWDASLWGAGWVLVSVGLLQGVASIVSQFI
jgi:hypothetical protein